MSGGGHMGFASRGASFSGFSGHGGFRGRGGFGVGSFPGGVRFRSGFRGPFRHSFRTRSFYGDYGYPWYPWYYGSWYPSIFDSDSSYVDANPYDPQAAGLADAVNRLSEEVDRLREERSQPSAPPPAPAESRTQAALAPATVLVFRNGNKQEVMNYAIVGQTLWVFSDQRAKKLSVADLDVPATTKANDDRGIDFALPR
jgi:hypothetical protein